MKALNALGFSLEAMRELLDVRDRFADRVTNRTDRARLLERLAIFAAVAEERCVVLRDTLLRSKRSHILHAEAHARR